MNSMRNLLPFSILACLLAACDRGPVGGQNSSTLTVVSYGGGAYQDSHRKAFIEPFAQTNQVQVESITWNAEYGKLKAMVQSGRVPWDVVEVTAGQFLRGKRENLYEPLEAKPDARSFFPGTVDDYGVANGYWGTLLAFRKDSFAGKEPASWSDFWDSVSFPGPRAMYDDPRGNLEMALLADGVPSERLYPLDVERAFRRMDAIKPHIRVWWTDGVQPIQLLLSKAVVMSTVWNTRIYVSEEAQLQVGYSWTGAPMELDYWIIPRGSNNRRLASDFILFASRPETVGLQVAMVGYGPVNTNALGFVSGDKRSQLPTFPSNWAKAIPVDAAWWADNELEIKSRWLAWKQR